MLEFVLHVAAGSYYTQLLINGQYQHFCWFYMYNVVLISEVDDSPNEVIGFIHQPSDIIFQCS